MTRLPFCQAECLSLAARLQKAQWYIAVCSANGVPSQVFINLAEQHVKALAEDSLKESCLGHGLPGFTEAEEGKAKLALKMIDAGIGISEPICMK